MPTLVYNCPSGISGDMNLAALVALGADPEQLITELNKLPYTGWKLRFENDIRNGITGTRCDVIDQNAVETKHSHEHSHDHSHHPDEQTEHSHTHKHEHTHHHGHSHSDSHSHKHPHHHRTFKEIREAIEQSDLNSTVKTTAIRCFEVLAEAEGSVHGLPPESVHFHEVGAIDSIIDMVGAAICWDLLGVDRIVCTTLEVGGGTVQCAHGRMPVPAPATAKLLQGRPFSAGATDKETTTPTGAALLVGKSAEFTAPTSGTLLKTATGIGQRKDPKLANALFVSLIDEGISSQTKHLLESDTVLELVANIDDMTAESVAHLTTALLETGALDVWQTAATFKKNRAGCIVHTLCTHAMRAKIENVYFTHSTTIGIRHQIWDRTKLPRRTKKINTKYGAVRIKYATLPSGEERFKIEFEDCARIAREQNLSLDEVRTQILSLLNQ